MQLTDASEVLTRSADSALPYRRVSRILHEVHATFNMLLDEALPRQFDRSIVLMVVMRVCAPDWVTDGHLHRPVAATRSVSINAISASLDRPFETIRRHVHALLATGICVAGPAGIALNPARVAVFDPIKLYARWNDVIVQFAEDLARFDLLETTVASPSPTLRLETVLAALDIALRPFEKFGKMLQEWTSARVWTYISVLNVRHVMLDPELDERYAFASTPDEVRRPVPLRTVERMFGMPYATLWRHSRALAAIGMMAETDSGWLVSRAQLRRDEVEEQVVASVRYSVRRLNALIRAGLRVNPPGSAYLIGRLSLAPVL